MNRSQLRSKEARVQGWMWGVGANQKAKGGWVSLLAVESSGAIVSSRVSTVARMSCFGSSTTGSRSLCCQHLSGGGRRHRAVDPQCASILVTCLVLVLVIPVSVGAGMTGMTSTKTRQVTVSVGALGVGARARPGGGLCAAYAAL